MDQKEKSKAIRHRSKKRTVILMGMAIAGIWLVLLIVKIVMNHADNGMVDIAGILSSIWDNILDNLLGILPPLILIDLLFEYLTQDFVSEEMSEQITDTLMSNPDTIRLFDDETKHRFLDATISTLVSHGQDEENMAISAIAPYIKSQYSLRKNFDYNISMVQDSVGELFDPDYYITVKETLSYSKHYIATEPLGSKFFIVFFVNNTDLDKSLRGQDFLFREALTIRKEELQKLICMTDEEKRAFVMNSMQLTVSIEKNRCLIEKVRIDDRGIIVQMCSAHDVSKDTLRIKTAFCMPQLRTKKSFLVSIGEPSYDISVRFDYPQSMFDVEMYPFFSDSGDALVEDSNCGVGSYEVCIRDKWVYPMSGIVFSIEAKR